MGNKLPTFTEVKRIHEHNQEIGMTQKESFEDVIKDMLSLLKAYKKSAESWMKDCDKLKAKYEPQIVELSQTDKGEGVTVNLDKQMLDSILWALECVSLMNVRDDIKAGIFKALNFINQRGKK